MADQSRKEGFDNLSTDNWKTPFLFETLNSMQQNIDSSARNNEQNYTSQNSTIMESQGNSETTDENFANWNWKGTNENDSPTTSVLFYSKITEDDLFHKKAARKFAELEVQRKVLEIERLQWEFQKDKYQSDIRWAYELRIMQYSEERAKHKLMESI